jgi:hypothetical protein
VPNQPISPMTPAAALTGPEFFVCVQGGDTRSTTATAVSTFVGTLFAPLASPTFTGDPKAPTPSPGDNDTSIATTAFVVAGFQAADPQLSSLIRQNSQSTAYTTVLADAGKHLLHPSADTTARTFTIAANSSVAYAIGTALTFVNQNAAGVLTIAIASDTMRLAGAGTTGSRTLAANGMATALKLASTEWIISGTGLT